MSGGFEAHENASRGATSFLFGACTHMRVYKYVVCKKAPYPPSPDQLFVCITVCTTMTEFAYPIPQEGRISMLRLLQHNYTKDHPEQTRLQQCDAARVALVQYLQEYGDAKLGLCAPPFATASSATSTCDHSSLQLARSVLDHHLHVAALSTEYASAWINLIDAIERAGPGRITMSLSDRARVAGPLFEWRGSASLRCSKSHVPVAGGDCSMRFESVMILVCAAVAYLNSAMAMRSYTALAERVSDAFQEASALGGGGTPPPVTDESTTRAIASDIFAMNKGALIYVLEAQQQLQLFRLAPTDSLAEMRPRTLEALASHASYCVQQMALPRFVEQHRLNAPGGTRQLCAAYMALASLCTTTCAAANSAEHTMVDAADLWKVDESSHLALVGQLSRSYNLVHAMVLRAEALLNEAHRRFANAETTRAYECLRGARLLVLFGEQEARLGTLSLTRASSTCPLHSVKNHAEVSKRWSTTCTERLAQWHEQVTQKVAHMLDLTNAAAVNILPSGTFATMDTEMLQNNVHQLLQWLPQRPIKLSEAEVAQRLWCALQASGVRQYNGAQSLAHHASPDTAVHEAARHVTTSPMWVLPPVPGMIREASPAHPPPTVIEETPSSQTTATIAVSQHTMSETVVPTPLPSLENLPTTPESIIPPAAPIIVSLQLPRVPTAPLPVAVDDDERILPPVALAN